MYLKARVETLGGWRELKWRKDDEKRRAGE